MPKYLLYLVFLAGLTACADDEILISGCEALGDIKPVCGMQAPEDLAALPDGRHLLLAHFGGMDGGRGSLSLFDTVEETVRPLFPSHSAGSPEGVQRWGDPSCRLPEIEKFSPHGTHLHQLDDGRWRYLVVNHGGRESIELFELSGEGIASELQWRGCVLAAPSTFMNDVVGLSNGDLVYSRMFRNLGFWSQLKSLVGMNTGDLWHWSPDTGLSVLPGTDANQPNGLEISHDDQFVYANMYFSEEVWKVDAKTGEVVGKASISSVDNSAWGSDGRLLLVSHRDSAANLLSCFGEQSAPCGAGFEVIALDPDTMEHETVFAHRGPPMGAATVAVPQAGRIYMGSFVGDRLISVSDFSRPR